MYKIEYTIRIAKDKNNIRVSISSTFNDIYVVNSGDEDFIGGWDDIVVKTTYSSMAEAKKEIISHLFLIF